MDIIKFLDERINKTKFGKSGGARFIYDNLLKGINTLGTSSSTGSGKTTCIAQICAKLALEQNKKTITTIITIPQRNSAINMCKYLNAGLPHELFGYIIHGESYVPKTCLVTFTTTGWSSSKILGDPNFKFDIFVLDEAHETNVDISLLFASLYQLNNLQRSFQLIISSATIDRNDYCKHYPKLKWFDEKQNESIHKIKFLKANEIVNIKSPSYNHSIVTHINNILNTTEKNHILVHLDGQERIENIYSLLLAQFKKDNTDVLIYPLYSQLPKDEQILALSKSSKRKIILATNIVESSITIDDVSYGICMPYHKIPKMTSDSYLTLELTNCSKRNIIQRHGRIGRVPAYDKKGQLIKGYTLVLTTENEYKKLKLSPEKEIDTNPLFHPILKFYASYLYQKANVKIEDYFLNISKKRIATDSNLLLEYGLIELNDKVYNITHMGKTIAKLPTSIPNGYVIYHAIQKLPKEYWFTLCFLIAIKENQVNPFYIPRDKRDDKKYTDKFKIWHKKDDITTIINLMNEYSKQWEKRKERGWCQKNNLYQLFFENMWKGSKKLLVFMVALHKNTLEDASYETLQENLKHVTSEIEIIQPYQNIEAIYQFLAENMLDRVFIAFIDLEGDPIYDRSRGIYYITKRDHIKRMAKMKELLDQDDGTIVIEFDIDLTVEQILSYLPNPEEEISSILTNKFIGLVDEIDDQSTEISSSIDSNSMKDKIKEIMTFDRSLNKFIVGRASNYKAADIAEIISFNVFMDPNRKNLGYLSQIMTSKKSILLKDLCSQFKGIAELIGEINEISSSGSSDPNDFVNSDDNSEKSDEFSGSDKDQ
ncbi:MAG: pre-mRNA-splicing factor ATP-dependent RNA helicase PRP16 [Harvfovirus sp.]|uniref:RNA helicase n=1 Tax=Harvfovirus sp. TaxID=2487768 RepID=A0A3G5A2R3_9VIRU|nr:MAG: pre-mRNA-splicing factor ATP-dependent RNA helicase PRP16 [Harvfovirus sp.]